MPFAKGKTVRLQADQPVGPTCHVLQNLDSREDSFELSASENLTCLENSKPVREESQEFACLGNTNQNIWMHIYDIRRANLRKWFATRSIPPERKSHISQLLKDGNPFGERAARRLEEDQGMTPMSLDAPEATGAAPQSGVAPSLQSAGPDVLRQAIELLELFQSTDDRGRADMLRLAKTIYQPAIQGVTGNES